jgi:hypothetical protein
MNFSMDGMGLLQARYAIFPHSERGPMFSNGPYSPFCTLISPILMSAHVEFVPLERERSSRTKYPGKHSAILASAGHVNPCRT